MLIIDILMGCQDSQLIDLEVSDSLQLRGNLIYTLSIAHSHLIYIQFI